MEFNLVEIKKSNLEILENLFQLYIHDISYYLQWDVDEKGRFFAYSLSEWLDNKDNFGYLVYSAEKLCGFVMVDREFKVLNGSGALNLSEIFILNSYKNKGLATSVLNEVFARHKACWEVRPVFNSENAVKFWEHYFNKSGFESKLVEWKNGRYAYTFSNK